MNTQPVLEQVKSAMRASWMAGDFGVVAKTISTSAEAFVERLQIAPGARILDVATGTGNVAIPLARRGAVVTGLDLAPNLLVQARERASAEGLQIGFDEGDAEELPYADGSFDVVTSMFGAMFAPRPERVAAELARVLKPGGLLAMANWNPSSFSGKMFQVSARHMPPPPGIVPPVLWGDETMVRTRLADSFTDIEATIIPINFDMPTDAAGAVAFFRKYFGPTHVAFHRLEPARQAALASDLEALWAGANIAEYPENQVLVRNEYLEVRAKRR